MKIKISTVIICFNEEDKIKRCLDSVSSVSDEILVVDSYSTDNTEKICIEHGARFIKHSFEGHIQQKNFAKNQASFDYVLSLDADEELTDEAQKSILRIKESCQFDAYWFNRRNNYCGKWLRHSGWYPDRKLRLWNRNKGQWTGQNPHDEFRLDSGTSDKLEGDILHYTIDSIEQHLKQIEYFTDISSQALFDKGKKASSIKPYISGSVKFLRDYFLKLGILDGRAGWNVARYSAKAKFLKYHKLNELHKS